MAGGHDDRTEVLTSAGWIPWPDIQGHEVFGTVQPESGALVFRKATAVLHARYQGRMYRVRSEQVDLLVTPDQQVWVQRVDTQAARRGEQAYRLELPEKILHKRVRYQKTARWLDGLDADVEIPSTSRAWVRSDNGASCVRQYPGAGFPARPFAAFLGYYLAEGSVNAHQIVLAQNRGAILDKMTETIRLLGLPAYMPESGAGCVRTQCLELRDFLAVLGHARQENSCRRGHLDAGHHRSVAKCRGRR